MKNKEFKVPDALAQIIINADVAKEKLPEMIVKCISEVEKQKQEFWETAKELFPELKGEKMVFDHKTKIITIKEQITETKTNKGLTNRKIAV